MKELLYRSRHDDILRKVILDLITVEVSSVYKLSFSMSEVERFRDNFETLMSHEYTLEDNGNFLVIEEK